MKKNKKQKDIETSISKNNEITKQKSNPDLSKKDDSLLGKSICVKIDSLNINGEGVSTYQDKKVCVNGVLVNEEVLCEVVSEKPTFLGCKLLQVLKPSSTRITPKCKYSQLCGGCNLDYVDYKTALEIKRNILKNYFLDYYNGQVDLVESDNQFNYRNKVSFCVKNSILGLKTQGTNNVIKIDKCLLASNRINDVISYIEEFVKKINSFSLKHVVVRDINNSIMFTFVFDKIDNKKINIIKEFCQDLNKKANFDFGAYINVNKSNFEILGKEWHHIYGLTIQKDILNNKEYEIHPYSFLQVNNNIRNKIYNYVFDNIKDEVVIEGYSGAGIMSCMLAEKAKQVISVEINTKSHLNAEEARLKNNILNLTNINDSCQNILPKLVEKFPDSIFLIDPPRSGCDLHTLEALKNSNIKKIIYISCNPYTLQQNIVYLKEAYKIESLTLFDMFPQTFHMETVAILARK